MTEVTTGNSDQKIFHITAIEVTNFKRIRRATISDLKQMGLIRLLGENANGKSSFLDALYAGSLGSKDAVCNNPIRNGQPQADLDITYSNDEGESFRILTTLIRDEETPRGFIFKLKARYADN